MSEEILVACIGNIFLGDDGFGVEVARQLQQAGLPDEARVVDYGIRGFDLAWALLEPWRAVVLVDAIRRGECPGTLYLLQPAGASHRSIQATPDPHAMHPEQVIALSRSFGSISAEIFIVGCEPLDFGDDLEGRMGLSPEVARVIPQAVSMISELVTKLRSDAEPAYFGPAQEAR